MLSWWKIKLNYPVRSKPGWVAKTKIHVHYTCERNHHNVLLTYLSLNVSKSIRCKSVRQHWIISYTVSPMCDVNIFENQDFIHAYTLVTGVLIVKNQGNWMNVWHKKDVIIKMLTFIPIIHVRVWYISINFCLLF